MLTDIYLMDDERLDEALEDCCDVLSRETGRWVVAAGGRKLIVVTDERKDRMRIMAPVALYDELTERDLRVLLASNFDRTLDARYATAGGYLWAAYLHPLSTLSHRQVAEGLRQVVALADNYRGSYAAGDLVFTGGRF